MTKAKPFDAARSLTDEEAIRRYLGQSFEAGDPASCQQTLGKVARPLGVKDIADNHVGFDTMLQSRAHLPTRCAAGM